MQTRSLLPSLLTASLFACAGTSSPGDGSSDATPTGNCSRPVSGSSAFARTLVGTANFSVAGGQSQQDSFEIDAYFPQGRVAGAPVYLAHPSVWPAPGLTVVQATLDSGLGASNLVMRGSDGRDYTYAFNLVGPSQGTDGHLERNFTPPGMDVGMDGEASMQLCDGGDAPAFALSLTPRSVGLTTPLHIASTAPLDVVAANWSVLSDSGPVAVTVTASNGGIDVAPATAFPPGAALTLEGTDVHDVIGRSATLQTTLTVLATTDVIHDLTFAAAPPSEAIATDGTFRASNGILSVGAMQGHHAWTALLSLGDPGTATTVRASLAVPCTESHTSVSLVAADGAVNAMNVVCTHSPSDAPVAATATIPGSGALWLVLTDNSPENHPQSVPYMVDPVRIDSIALE